MASIITVSPNVLSKLLLGLSTSIISQTNSDEVSMLPILGIFIALLGASPADATQPPIFITQQITSISGHVTDNSRNPIPDLQVELLDDVDSVIARTKTDNSGLFSF